MSDFHYSSLCDGWILPSFSLNWDCWTKKGDVGPYVFGDQYYKQHTHLKKNNQPSGSYGKRRVYWD